MCTDFVVLCSRGSLLMEAGEKLPLAWKVLEQGEAGRLCEKYHHHLLALLEEAFLVG